MNADSILKEGKFSVSEQTYAILQTTRSVPDAFASICCETGNTVIMSEPNATHTLPRKDILAMDANWSAITFEMKIPIDSVGFLASISSKLAAIGIPIFIVSGFCSDHLLVKNNRLADTIAVLEELGMSKV